MRLVPVPPEIGDKDGFKPGTDIFGYKEFGEHLANFVEKIEGPAVIALDGGWGTGKTVFAKQWAGLLRDRGTAVIYFDAFATDSGDDPLFDIASQLFQAAKDRLELEHVDSLRETLQKFTKTAVTLAKSLAPLGAGLGLRAVSGGFAGGKEIREFGTAIAAARAEGNSEEDLVSEAFRRRLEGAKDRATVLEDFRRSLTNLATELRSHAAGSTQESRPVVMIVDELDRCKPTYALRLLENLKHVFSVDTMCFVLVTNMEQIRGTIHREYGDIDAERYLEKFVHATFHLQQGVSPVTKRTQEIYQEYLWKKMVPHSSGMPLEAADIIKAMAMQRKLSLRGMYQVMRNIGICSSVMGIPQDMRGSFIAIVCLAHVLEPTVYSRIRNGTCSGEGIREFLGDLDLSGPQRDGIKYVCRHYFPPASVLEAGVPGERTRWEAQRISFQHGDISVSSVCRTLDAFGQSAR